MTATDQLAVDTLRTLSIDAVQKANSGHPGAPMGLAPVAYSLWQEALRYDPAAPQWPSPSPASTSGQKQKLMASRDRMYSATRSILLDSHPR